jgi:hypothetical protein
MPQARGFFERVALIFESTFNTTPTVTTGDMVAMPMNSIGLGSDENMIDPETIIPTKRWESEPIFGNISVQGPITVPMDVRYIGYWFKLLFGAPTTTGAGPYTHTFEPSTETPSATIETGFTDIAKYLVYNGVKINSMSMNFTVDTELTVEMDLLGGKELASSGTALDSAPVEHTITRFNAQDIVLKKGGVTVAIARSVGLNINNGLVDDVYTLSSGGFRHSLPEAKLMIGGTAELLFIDTEWTDLAINGTEFDLEISMATGAHSLTITLPEVKMRRQPIQRNGHGPMYVAVDFKAYFQDDVAGLPISVELINDVTDYA